MPLSLSPALLQRLIRNVSGAIISVFFPGDCRLCKGLLTNASRLPICEECLRSFRAMPSQICQLCGQPDPPAAVQPSAADGAKQISVCARCQQQKYSFEVARSFGQYEGSLARAIVLLKFERIEPLGEWFAGQLESVVRANGDCLHADVIVPVPLHRQRLRERGFNQVELFGRPLAKRLGLPFRPIIADAYAPPAGEAPAGL